MLGKKDSRLCRFQQGFPRRPTCLPTVTTPAPTPIARSTPHGVEADNKQGKGVHIESSQRAGKMKQTISKLIEECVKKHEIQTTAPVSMPTYSPNYRRNAPALALLSTGPKGPNHTYPAPFMAASSAGT